MNFKTSGHLQAGKTITGFFILRKKELRIKRNSDEYYLALELGDIWGRVRGTVWENSEKIFKELNISEVVKVQAKVINFKGKLHLSIKNIRCAKPEEKISPEDFVPICSEDIEKMLAKLDVLIDSVNNIHLSQLLSIIFTNTAVRKKLVLTPAGKLWHHNYRGGLLQHTLAVAEICEVVRNNYTSINRDLLITAALLHDIGKIDELSVQGFIDYSDEGRLIGHIVLGTLFIAEKIGELTDFPKNLRAELLHLVLSHQGKLTHGSPVVPKTLEAIILYYADELDSQGNAFDAIISKNRNTGKNWSSYIALINRFIYLGK